MPAIELVTSRDIVVVGTSAGGVEALIALASMLPPDLDASLFVVMHTLASSRSLLPQILSGRGPLPAVAPENGAPIERGHIYVAPPDCHLLVREGHVELLHGPKSNGHRPAVDPLFRSAAEAYGARVAGVVLTGGQDCGAAGLLDIKRRGGTAIVQDPATAAVPDMPRAALATGVVDYCLPLEKIAPLLVRLGKGVPPGWAAEMPAPARPHGGGQEARMTEDEHQPLTQLDEEEWQNGQHTDFSCPDCGGVLREVRTNGKLLRFRCRIGHALSADSLEAGQQALIETALSAAMRSLNERAELCRRIAGRAGPVEEMRRVFEERARQAEQHARVLREMLLEPPRPGREPDDS